MWHWTAPKLPITPRTQFHSHWVSNPILMKLLPQMRETSTGHHLIQFQSTWSQTTRRPLTISFIKSVATSNSLWSRGNHYFATVKFKLSAIPQKMPLYSRVSEMKKKKPLELNFKLSDSSHFWLKNREVYLVLANLYSGIIFKYPSLYHHKNKKMQR